ncbi:MULTISPECIES: class I SAM-dependent methyltransferase [unclassified Bradyrhizobium]|uniref:class I SAM-dependent methyltransferase n=1 Tax=unclassified Bradyrhizobium TaxID=2631580 RepID=UPI0020B1A75C|nr:MULTISPECIES: class I SAM-dependent methyltransferase [unclassified Bradyrhizobium]MCP3396855.1 class I SAM-dependent methyltransferase [Bradyrhizobium sp. CCGB20]MCP3405368.1 class I SAM-dependent methyltransferase [Bradyrhizobium sp. CCGB01]
MRAAAVARELASPDEDLSRIYAGIAAYYSGTVARYGATPPGVDWTCQATQEMRFVQLLKLCDFGSPFSLNDLGCGYGALIAFLDRRHHDCTVDYLGIDLSDAMVRRARRLWQDRSNAAFVLGHASPRMADYAVASGIFNVAQQQPRHDWERFIAASLDDLHRTTRRGFAVNFMKSPPGAAVRPGLYTTDTASWARYCATRFNAAAEVHEGYGLMEFTLIVRRV